MVQLADSDSVQSDNTQNALAMTVDIIDEDISIPDHVRNVSKEYTHQGLDDAFFICDVGQIIRQHEKWNYYFPRVEPHYAVKCNGDPILLNLLNQLGLGFDCASKNEIQTMLGLGVEPERIIYANPCKTSSYIKFSKSTGVNLMTFDNAEELYKIKRLFPTAKLVLRIFAMDTSAQCPLSLKFGCEPKDEGIELLRIAGQLGLDIVGVSFHVGSGCNDPTAYSVAIADAKNLFDYGPRYGHDNMHILDIGGGFPGVDTKHISLEKVANVVNASVDYHFPRESGVRIIAEPGRFYACAAFTGCFNIIAKHVVPANKITEDDADNGEMGAMYYLNDGMYGTFSCIMFDHSDPQVQLVNKPRTDVPEMWSNIWGPTCDSIDLIAPKIKLPDLQVGDWLMYQNHGAYTLASATTFNGFDKMIVHHVARPTDIAILNKCFGKSSFNLHSIGEGKEMKCIDTFFSSQIC